MNGCDVNPPRLGHVGDFELTVATRHAIDFSQGLRGDDAEKVVRSHEMTGSSSAKDIAQSETLDILKAIHLRLVNREASVPSLKRPLWLIVFLLAWLLFR